MFSNLRPTRISFLVWFYCLLLFSFHADASPLLTRQSGSPQTVTTIQTTETAAGAMTETCVIALSPIKDKNGNDAVQMVQSCTIKMEPPKDNGGGNSGESSSSTIASYTLQSSSPSTTIAASKTSSFAGSSTFSSAAVPATTSAVSSPSVPPPPPASSSASVLSSATSSVAIPTESPAVSVNGLSTVLPSTTALPTTAAPSPTIVAPAVTSAAPPTKAPTSSSATGAAASAAAAEQASASATGATFTLPGKKLSVLPIGLGVFAGISVIALIVVGLVTYERTKYRKAFRQRKLAENGQAMGYGGMTS